jgi:hypothetical protein
MLTGALRTAARVGLLLTSAASSGRLAIPARRNHLPERRAGRLPSAERAEST